MEPHLNYEHLLLEDKRRSQAPETEHGWSVYRDNILPRVGNYPPRIMKLECYGVGSRPDSNPGPAQPPTIYDPEAQERRKVRPGDRIEVSGLYVTDNDHGPYWDLFTSSWTYMRGLYKVGRPHAEIHPYNFGSVALAHPKDWTNPSTDTHTVGAPVRLGQQ